MKPSGILPSAFRPWIPFAALFVILVLILPRSPKFGYEYKKGSEWKYETLYSQFDFPVFKTEEQIQEERSRSGAGVVPYYKYSEDIVSRNLKAAESLQMGQYASLKSPVIALLREIYVQGIVSDEGVRLDRNVEDPSGAVLYIQKDKRATKYPVTEVYKQSDAKSKLVSDLSRTHGSYNLDSIFRACGVYDLIVPNLLYDKQTTELVHAESVSEISPTRGFVNAGQLIVSSGEIVTAEIAQMLDSYKREYEANMGYAGPKALFWLGNILLSLVLVLILYLAIFFTNRTAFRETNKLLYILLVFLIATIGAIVVSHAGPKFLYMVPFTLSALWLQAFFKNKLIITVYIVSLLPLLLFTESGVVLFTMFLVGGFVAIFSFRFFNVGWKQFVTAGFTFLALVLTYFAFRLIDAVSGNVFQVISYLAVGSLVTVLGYAMVSLFEKMFNLVSTSSLIELGDSGNPMLQDFESKAPGSFQHSLQVMTMAESVARAIGADALIVRAGSLYHDIGKMNNPQCFIENESLINVEDGQGYHSGLTPKQSAQDIIRHVNDGLAIAERLKLPQFIKDFILTHHGTTCTSYFYNKYLNDGGDQNDTAEFFYPGKRPVTKEQIIVMLCDTVEAASRTLKSSTAETFSNFVDGVVASKMKDGQFDESDISLKELSLVKEALKTYLVNLYHERVVYPKRKGKSVH